MSGYACDADAACESAASLAANGAIARGSARAR